MAEGARQSLHDLVEKLPPERLSQARNALERLRMSEEERAEIDRRDAEIINAHADELNAEAEDVLGYQADW